MSQKILQYIEIDVDYCSLSYGVLPCTASLVTSPPTGSIKCFNTLTTCQDRDNFTNEPVTLRFAVPTDYLPADIECIPDIKSITFDPMVISLGQNLGQRATLTVNFSDHRHSDTGEGYDKYLADRDYDPYQQGTFWGKFAARQPFVRGRPLRWITGDTDQALADMETRHYIIDSFSGPDNDGAFKIIAKDLLKLADGDRALAPAVSTGFLVSAISNVDTVLTLSPSGIGSTYPDSGYIAIGGSEVCSFTRIGDGMNLGRGASNTVPVAHAAQDRVQLCTIYFAQSPDIIIADLLTTYAGIDASYIPADIWAAEVAAHLNRQYTAVIAQPTAVNTLISELIEQAGLSMWWDDRNQEIGLLVLRGLIYTNYFFNEDNIIADTLQIAEQPDKRLSQVHTYFGQINPLTSLTDKANYRSVSYVSDVDSEADYGSAAIKEIFSRWIPALGRTVADRLGDILIGRFRDPPRKISFSSLRNSTPNEIVLASGYQVEAWPLQDATGANETVNVQVTRMRPNPDVIEIETEEVLFTAPEEDLSVRNIIIDADIWNVNLRTAHDSLFPAPETGITVVCTINSGVRVGSASPSSPAFDVGSWPLGVLIILVVNGGIRGAGGSGGSPFGSPAPQDGGIALYVPYQIKLSLSGTIYSGGGGGGGATALSAGGGGGAGWAAGAGAWSGGQNGTEFSGGVSLWALGGTGGDVGQPGQTGYAPHSGDIGFNGALAGYSIYGVANIVDTGTWDGSTFISGALGGDVRGATV